MDRFDAMRVFTRVVERRSFTLAAEDLALPRSTVTDAVKQLEARLGVRLLQRTTRHVSPTLDGEAYHRRCLALIADLEDAEAAFGGAKPKGLLRVDAVFPAGHRWHSPRKSGSHRTPRWREMDSNPRSPVSRIYANTGIAPDRDTGRANRRENRETAGLAPLRDQRR